MKGKGDQQTYWLVGEDKEMRRRRNEERARKRLQAGAIKSTLNGQFDSNGHCIVPRSSLKNKNIARNTLARCSSFESPKKLRFASGDNL